MSPLWTDLHRRQVRYSGRRQLGGYVLALGGVGLVGVARYAAWDLLGDVAPAIPFVIPVAIAAWYGGLGPGLLATTAGALVSTALFVPPAFSLHIANPGEGAALVLFIISGAIVSALSESMHAARQRSEERRLQIQSVADGVPALISYIDCDARYRLNNRAYETWFGVPRGKMVGRHMRDVLGDAAWDAVRPHVERALSGERVSYQGEVPYREGGTRWIAATYSPDVSPQGLVRGIIAHVHDITESVTAVRRQRDTEQRLRALMDGSPLAVVEWDAQFVIVRWTGQSEAIFGWTAAEIVGRRLGDFPWVLPEDQPRADESIARLLDPRSTFVVSPIRNLTKAGDVRSIEWYQSVLHDESGRIVAVQSIGLDVTDRERAQQALRRAEERFRASQEASLLGFTILNSVRDADGRIVDFEWEYANPAAGAILGHPPGYLVGKRLLDVLPENRDGSDLFARYVRVVETGKPHDYELCYRGEGVDGWFRNIAVKLGDGVAVSFTDVTDRYRREVALQEADRRKDEFLATLAHELRNPLAPIRNAVQVLKLKGPAEPELIRSRDIIDRQVALMARLLDDLLDVSRITRSTLHLQRRHVSLQSVIDAAIETSRPLLDAASHRLIVSLPDTPVMLEADPVRLAQVFANILNNAAKYTEPGGTLEVTTLTSPGEVAVTVTDTGIGIQPDMLPRVFEMFSQADPAIARAQGGLGIGLSLARALVEMHGGRIAARSEGAGRGTAVEVRLPLTQAKAAPVRPPAAWVTAAAPPCRVLVADDNADSVETLSLMLQIIGHDVRTASDGQEAVDVARAFRPEVVLLDIGMPRMNGYEAARAIRAEPWGAEICLVALTGWGQEEDRRRALEAGFDVHLVKPVAPETIARVLAKLPHRA